MKIAPDKLLAYGLESRHENRGPRPKDQQVGHQLEKGDSSKNQPVRHSHFLISPWSFGHLFL